MKTIRFAAPLLAALFLLNGCSGEKADATRSAADVRQEAAGMGIFRLKKTVANYDKAIAEKEAQGKAERKKLDGIPVQDRFSEEAKALYASLDRTQISLLNLRANRQVYADALQRKQQ